MVALSVRLPAVRAAVSWSVNKPPLRSSSFVRDSTALCGIAAVPVPVMDAAGMVQDALPALLLPEPSSVKLHAKVASPAIVWGAGSAHC